TWTTSTAGTTVLTPAAAAPTAGANYNWRVRALGPYPPSDWSTSARFVRVTSVALPPSPVLAAPTNGSTLPGSTALFEWNAAAGATEYRLEVSPASDFPASPSQTWSRDAITATSCVMTFPSGL